MVPQRFHYSRVSCTQARQTQILVCWSRFILGEPVSAIRLPNAPVIMRRLLCLQQVCNDNDGCQHEICACTPSGLNTSQKG